MPGLDVVLEWAEMWREWGVRSIGGDWE